MSQIPNKIRLKLNGKCILIVDDHRITIEPFRNALHVCGAKTDYADGLEEAIILLDKARNNKGWNYDAVVIDLDMPVPIPPRLQGYLRSMESPDCNHGQLLGLYLDEQDPPLKYTYLSVVVGAIKKQSGINMNNKLIDKYEQSNNVSDFPKILCEKLKW